MAMKSSSGSRRVVVGIFQFGFGVLLIVGLTVALQRTSPKPSLPPGWTIIRPPHEVSALAVQGDVVWAGGQDGLVAIDRKTARVQPELAGQPSLRNVKDLLVDRRSRLWIAHGGGLTRYADGEWQSYSGAAGFFSGPAAALWEDHTGAIWVGLERGVGCFDGQAFQIYTSRDGLGLPAVDVIFQDRDGVIWFGSSSPVLGGLASFDGRTWRTYSTQDGLAHNSIIKIMQDRLGTLWFATGFASRGGASRLADSRWTTWTRQDGLAGEKVRSIFEDRDGRLWFGSEYDGIAVYDGAAWQVLTPEQGLAGWEVKEMVQDSDGMYWLATENGVSRISQFTMPSTGKEP
jgi:ligand-binding sensor domain-containing protein